MRLTTKNVTPYLVDKGFLSPTDLINGDYQMTQQQSRNCIFQISLGPASGLFVKQLVQMDPQNVYLMQKDATVHHLVNHAEFYEPLKKYVPEYLGYDPSRQVLVTENFVNAANLFEAYNTANEIAEEDAKEIADILFHLHQDITEEIKTNKGLQFFNRDLPWILKVMEMPLEGQPVLQLVKNDAFLYQQLHELSQEWQGNSMTHGDIKFVNFLKIYQDNQPQIKLIDWEIANIGDPLWDVAGFFQSYLSFWAMYQSPSMKMPQNQGKPVLWTLENCKNSTQVFWKQYVENHGWEAEEAEQKLVKAAKMTAARLLQTAKETNFINPKELQESSVMMVQLAQNIFKSPLQAAADLLGIKLGQ